MSTYLLNLHYPRTLPTPSALLTGGSVEVTGLTGGSTGSTSSTSSTSGANATNTRTATFCSTLRYSTPLPVLPAELVPMVLYSTQLNSTHLLLPSPPSPVPTYVAYLPYHFLPTYSAYLFPPAHSTYQTYTTHLLYLTFLLYLLGGGP